MLAALAVFLLTLAPMTWLCWRSWQNANSRDLDRLNEFATAGWSQLARDRLAHTQKMRAWEGRIESLPMLDQKGWDACFDRGELKNLGRFRQVGAAILETNDTAPVRFVVGGPAIAAGLDLRSISQVREALDSMNGQRTTTAPFSLPGGTEQRLAISKLTLSGGQHVILFVAFQPGDWLQAERHMVQVVNPDGSYGAKEMRDDFLPGISDGQVSIQEVSDEERKRVRAGGGLATTRWVNGPLAEMHLVFRPGAKFYNDSLVGEARLTGIICAILSLLLAAVIWMQARQRSMLKEQVLRQTAELTRANEELVRFKAMVDTTSDLVGICEFNGTPIYMNAAGRALLGIGKDEDIRNFPMNKIYPSGVLELFAKEGIPHALEHGSWGTELNMVHKDGHEIPVSFVGFVTKSAEGQPLHLGVMARDIRARHQLDLQLRESLEHERELVRLKSQFVNTVSHEFRTPLGVILSSADILAHYIDRLPAESRQQHLQDIHASSRHMARMLDQVLELGRIEAGKLGFAAKPLDLASLLQRIVDESQSASSGCKVDLEIVGDLTGAAGDESLLRHIVFNILSNARKYSPATDVVHFKILRDGKSAIITVVDHGIGIPAADLPHLFEAFSRAGNVGDTPGTGLGLAIAKRCAELHAGTLDIQSLEGAGTTVTITLPLFATPSNDLKS